MTKLGPVIAFCVPAALAAACRVQPTAAPRPGDPVVLVSPDTGPSALQQRLAAQPAVRITAGSPALDARLDAFFTRTAHHRGYLAVDKPLYQPGETIWLRLFDLASADLGGGTADVAATVKLVSPRGSTVAEKQIEVAAGGGGGDFVLAAGLPGGEYTLTATMPGGPTPGATVERHVIVAAYEAPRIKKKLELTRKAYGPGDPVTATVAVHRATGEPLGHQAVVGVVSLDGAELARVPATTDGDGNAVIGFSLPATIRKGDGLITVLVDDGGVTESVQKRIPITLQALRLSLFPEGGELITGLPGRVYFAARNPLDKPADIEGRVVDDRGSVVALLRSYHDGMGRFELYPEPGRRYHVEITRPAGLRTPFELPAARDHGCAMQAIDDYASARPELRLAVWCTQPQALSVAAVLRERRIASAVADVRAGAPAVIALALPAGVQGAVRVTAFAGDQLAPVAERLIYRNRGADLKIALVADRASYHPRDRVTVAVETRGPDGAPVAADLALAAVDDSVLTLADDKQASLLARLYLEAELPGQKIEEPNFYFSNDKQAPAALDLVLGTLGWRRFDWKRVFDGPAAPPIRDSWAFAGPKVAAPVHHGAVRHRGAVRDPDGVPDAVDAAEPEPAEAAEAAEAAKPGKAAKVAEAEEVGADEVPRNVRRRPAHAAPRDQRERRAAKAAELDDDDAKPARIHAAEAVEAADVDEEMVAEAVVLPVHRNFGIGVDGELRKHQIRGEAHAAKPPADDLDPLCCVEPERVFPQPAYDADYDGPRTDFRDTVAWQSRLRTDDTGKATIAFVLSDAVTSFKLTAEGVGGGRLGHAEALVQSKRPVSIAAVLPLEVSAGDHLRLPVTVSNETDQRYRATLEARFGAAFKLTGGTLAPVLELGPGERRSTFYELDVVGDGRDAAAGALGFTVDAAHLRDELARTIRVVPAGFPQEASLAGTLRGTVRHEITISDALPGTLRGDLTLYPSPLATMVAGTEAMIAEPGGCFEQASSANYPNIMILGYLEENRAASPAIVEHAQTALDHGYKLLAGYETPTKGYEWFGANPGHEALTAYGLLEFHDMAKVYGDVDRAMIERTRAWLRGRRDGAGGFQRNPRQLDSFGSASAEVTNAYITYALSEAGEHDLGAEVAVQRRSAATTRDPYLLALATKVLLAQAPADAATGAAVARLAAMQAADGAFPGADHSITRSGGESLAIETTSLATLALIAAGPAHVGEVRKAAEWIEHHRGGAGNFGSTQSTVLALEALAASAKASRRTQASGVVTLVINGATVGTIAYDKGHQGALELPIAQHLRPGKNVVEISLDSSEPLPYTARVQWTSKLPAADPATAVQLATHLARATARLGESVHLDVVLRNVTDHGVPMTLARVGLPGGTTFQTWQLQELRDKHLIDFYETRPREVILYARALEPHAVRELPLELLTTVPGRFTGPASRAYLYYTPEHKHWVAPSSLIITP